ncbi:MAG TPA: PAS domain S-box protein, partial [Prolixibacteraceae bacterium]|nr:PAS domain S-box protein [Prolixibacteraceae bacterium]
MLLVDPASQKILDANHSAERFYGWSKKELTSMTLHQINTLPADQIQREIEKARKNQRNYFEFRHRLADGSFRDVEVFSSKVEIDRQEYLHSIILDATEKHLSRKRLQENLDLFENLTARVPGVVYQYQLFPDGRSAFPYSSPGMWDIYEVYPEEVREDASPVFTRLHPDDYDYIVDTINESARNLSFYQSEFRVILPSQGLRWRKCEAKPQRMDDGSILWHGIISDITEQKIAQNEQLHLLNILNASINEIYLFHADDLKFEYANQGALKNLGYSL